MFRLDGLRPQATDDFSLVMRSGALSSPFSVHELDGRSLLLKSGDRKLLQYNFGVIPQEPDKTGPYDRAGYIHPVWSPVGNVVTGDFSPEHIHQRGIFTAFVKAALVLIGEAYVADTSRKVVRDRTHTDDTTRVAYRRVLIEQVVEPNADR